MQFDANTPRQTRTIQGHSLQVIAPYAEGMPLTEATAAMLNQTFAENISNNTREKIKAGVTEGEGDNATTREMTPEEAQALVDAYTAEYEPGVRSSGGGSARVTDPVEKEARILAREKVKAVLDAQGKKTKDVDYKGLCEKLFEANRDTFMAQGKKIVAAKAAAATKSEDGIDLSGLDLAA